MTKRHPLTSLRRMTLALTAVGATALLVGCDSSDSAPTTTSRFSAAFDRAQAEIADENAAIARAKDGFQAAWRTYTEQQKDDFCWQVYDMGEAVGGQNAFDYARQQGDSPAEAEAKRKGMIAFIREVC